ncbi:cytochrome P450 [Lasiosphaeria miniovina]|uniref:Cytochrome P450 n=1 Tax=Lasiosphaeria miniovina TaxID=1954250 RepID=A0AA40DYJ7_9PEZI|nr:cytochrome P450 [Lasiosphaeria miniovina]KAK0718402.1 cytochrome P450 [Lasiosphaeria miniovina]
MALSLSSCLRSWPSFYTVVGRRYFHPHTHVPGPFLWSVFGLPLPYQQPPWKGSLCMCSPSSTPSTVCPVVRISPDEIYFSDPKNYDRIHSVGSKFYKDPAFYGYMEGPLKTPIILIVIPNEDHRVRRAFEPIVRGKARKLVELIEATLLSGKEGRPGPGVFDAYHAVRAFSVDMDMENWSAGYQEVIRPVQSFFPWFSTFPFLSSVFGLVPDSVNFVLFPWFKKWYDSLQVIRTAATRVQKEISMGVVPPRRTIFHNLMDPPPFEDEGDNKKQRPRLSDEIVFADAVNVTGAGAETTGSTVGRTIFEVISNPVVYATLSQELREALPSSDPDTFSLVALEKLPYLSAVIKEAMRPPPACRPGWGAGVTFNGYTVLPGTVVSMSAWTLYYNTEAFPDPERFDPTRRTNAPSADALRAREKSMIPLGRGSRTCLGQNLALCELHYNLASIFRRFDFDGDSTGRRLGVHPDFARSNLQLVEMLLGYHPRKARELRLILESAK